MFNTPAVRRADNGNYISNEALYIETIDAEQKGKYSFIFNNKKISIRKVNTNEKEKEIFIGFEEIL